MVQIKVKKKVNGTTIIHKLDKNEQINTMELDIIEKGEIEALEPVRIISSFTGTKMKFVIKDHIDMPSLLRSGITFGEFIQIVGDMVEVFQECRSHGIRVSNLETRPEYIYYNYKGKKLKMIYWPLISLTNYADEKEAFRVLAEYYVCRAEDEMFKSNYVEYFGSRKKFDLFHFEQTVNTLKKCWENQGKKDEIIIFGPNEGTVGKKPVGGGESIFGATLKFDCPVLLRISTDEKIEIKKSTFVIGRDDACDYIISGDPYVSHKHAGVYRENGQVYIVDLQSLNGVSVNNGAPIVPEERVPLKSGDEIEIGNEKFIFFAQA